MVQLRRKCSLDFWHLFLPMHHFPVNVIDTVLQRVKKIYVRDDKKLFPSSRRALLQKTNSDFWTKVLHSCTIDLTHLKLSKPLASGTKSLKFEFLDPVWAWLSAAQRLHPAELHWKPAAQNRECPVYGGGVQYGRAFRQACASCPNGAYPMCVSFHWDGTSGGGLSATPICIGVGNTNSTSPDKQCCIGYMPVLPDMRRKEFADHSDSTTAKFHIRNECARAVLRVLEASAAGGVICRLPNLRNVQVHRLLFPRLTQMNLDQPEAQLFFGLKNKTSCSKCTWRKGYSAFRIAGSQNGSTIRRLYRAVKELDRRSAGGRAAREKLQRRGFHPLRECCLHSPTDVDKLLVRLQDTDEVFPCVDYRDRMHGIQIFLHRAIVEIWDATGIKPKQRRMLDERLAKVCSMRSFRDANGKSYRTQKSMFSAAGMTAHDKICWIFLVPHVLGTFPDVFPREVHDALLTALAHAQLILIAVSGRRLYTKPELQTIFDRGYLMIFGALESIRARDFNARQSKHQADPDTHPAPKRIRLQDRLTLHTILE